jgi:LacI family transcriptional regulator
VSATIAQVAQRAGVSPSTVSYVLTGNRRISEATRQRVQAAIRDLDYRPHNGARSLRSSRTNVIGLVMPFQEPHDVSALPFIGAIAESSSRQGVNLLLLTADRGTSEIERVVRSNMVDSVIVLQISLNDERVDTLAGLGCPVAMIGIPEDPQGLPAIDFDLHRAGAICVDHLAGLGHSSVAYIGQPRVMFDRGTAYVHRALQGAREAAERHGMSWSMQPCDASRAATDRAVRDLLIRQPDVTGLVVFNEPAVPHVLESLVSFGRRVPEDISVVSIGNESALTGTRPAVSGISFPAEELGRAAAEIVLAAGTEPLPATDPVLLPPTFVRRDSDMALGR